MNHSVLANLPRGSALEACKDSWSPRVWSSSSPFNVPSQVWTQRLSFGWTRPISKPREFLDALGARLSESQFEAVRKTNERTRLDKREIGWSWIFYFHPSTRHIRILPSSSVSPRRLSRTYLRSLLLDSNNWVDEIVNSGQSKCNLSASARGFTRIACCRLHHTVDPTCRLDKQQRFSLLRRLLELLEFSDNRCCENCPHERQKQTFAWPRRWERQCHRTRGYCFFRFISF